MKVSTGNNVKKYVDLEGGGGDKPVKILVLSDSKSSRCFNIIKIIFYLEIILFIGLIGLMGIQSYLARPRTYSLVSSSGDDGDVSRNINTFNDQATLASAIEVESSRDRKTSDEVGEIYKSLLPQELSEQDEKLMEAIGNVGDREDSELKFNGDDDNSHENYNSKVVETGGVVGVASAVEIPGLIVESGDIGSDTGDAVARTESNFEALLVDVFQDMKTENPGYSEGTSDDGGSEIVIISRDPEPQEKLQDEQRPPSEEIYATSGDPGLLAQSDDAKMIGEAEVPILQPNPEVLEDFSQGNGRLREGEGADGGPEVIKTEFLEGSIDISPEYLTPARDSDLSGENYEDPKIDVMHEIAGNGEDSLEDTCAKHQVNVETLDELRPLLPEEWSGCVDWNTVFKVISKQRNPWGAAESELVQ